MKSFKEIATERIQDILETERIFDFPEFIKKIREAAGLGQGYAEKEMGMKNLYLSLLESSKRFVEPTESELYSLSEYYEIPVHLLIAKKNKFMRAK